jgi:hypothetical protein
MATDDPPDAQRRAVAKAVGANGLLHVLGTGGQVTAAALRSHHDLDGREDDAVNPDEEDANGLHEPISMAQFLKKATREGRVLI